MPFSESRVHVSYSLLPLAGLHRFAFAFAEAVPKVSLKIFGLTLGPLDGVGRVPQLKQIQALAISAPGRNVDSLLPLARARRCRTYGEDFVSIDERKSPVSCSAAPTTKQSPALCVDRQPNEIDPLYLFACHIEWERREETTAGWELLAAAGSCNSEIRAQAGLTRQFTASGRMGLGPGPRELGLKKAAGYDGG